MISADRAAAKLRVDAALGDPEDELAVCPRRRELALRPRGRPLDRLGELGPRRAGRQADVERHGDVGAEPPLHVGRQLGREAREIPVVHGTEGDALVVGLRDRVPQREHLEPARVGEDRPVPGHERVEAAELLDQLDAGPEDEVVDVREDDRGTQLAHAVRVEPLDGRLRPDGHEGRRRNVAVRGAKNPGARGAVGGCRG